MTEDRPPYGDEGKAKITKAQRLQLIGLFTIMDTLADRQEDAADAAKAVVVATGVKAPHPAIAGRTEKDEVEGWVDDLAFDYRPRSGSNAEKRVDDLLERLELEVEGKGG